MAALWLERPTLRGFDRGGATEISEPAVVPDVPGLSFNGHICDAAGIHAQRRDAQVVEHRFFGWLGLAGVAVATYRLDCTDCLSASWADVVYANASPGGLDIYDA